MTLLLTGHNGFVGTHFREHAECVPLADPEGRPLDLLDAEPLSEAVAAAKPDAVVHLAAQAFVPESFRNPRRTFSINVMGTLNLLLALRECGFRGRFLYVSSGDVYGLVPPEYLPVGEDRPLAPRNPYATSKVAAEALVGQWGRTEGMEVVIARPFNHIGPGQQPEFVVSNFAMQIAAIRIGQQEKLLQVGDIEVTRDFTDVRDVVRAYTLLLDKGRSGEVYNVCSGEEVSCRAILETLLKEAGMEVRMAADPERMRPSEQRRVAGSCEKLKSETGWQPEVPLRTTLIEMLACWEQELQ